MKPELAIDKITLRQPKEGDLSDRLSYGQNPEIIRMFGGNSSEISPLSEEAVSKWLSDIKNSPHAWVVEHDGQLLGEAKLHSFSEPDRRARFAVGFYDYNQLGKGLGKKVTRLVLSYAFEQLNLHRVDLRVLAYNTRAIDCYQKCGFVIEGRERESAHVDGEWYDDLIMGILAKDFLIKKY